MRFETMPSRPSLQAWAKTVGAVAFHVFVEPNATGGLGHDRCKRRFAHLQRVAPEVVAIQFDQVEGVQEREVIMAAVANEIE